VGHTIYILKDELKGYKRGALNHFRSVKNFELSGLQNRPKFSEANFGNKARDIFDDTCHVRNFEHMSKVFEKSFPTNLI
jgi:hypothetical protein